MPQPLDLRIAIGLPPERAVEYFKAKGYAVTANWHDLWQEAHAKAFTVAGAMRMDVLQDIRGEVDRAIAGEITQADFIKNLRPRLQAKGWWGPQVLSDPETGDARIAQAGSPRRLETIFRTNLQAAFMAGRYKQMMENVRFRPYWQYVAIMDQKTRPAHAAMNGLVFRQDDPFWMSFFPPNGFNCRCTVRPLSFADIEAQGISTSVSGKYLSQAWVADPTSGLTERVSVFKTPSMSRAGRTDLGWNYNPGRAVSFADIEAQGISISVSGKYLRQAWVADPTSGLTERVSVFKTPSMPRAGRTDRGWNYNPGRAAWQPEIDRYDHQIAKQYVGGSVTGPDFARFVEGKEEGKFAVAVLSPADKERLGATSQAVLLSDATLAKQRESHPEIGLADYQRLQVIVDTGEVYRQGNLRLMFLETAGEWSRAVVKVTRDGAELFLVSLFRSRASEAEKAKKTLEKLR